jgi:hypothetical protein
VAPAALVADRGEQAPRRAPILQALVDVRQASQTRVGLSRFARPCVADELLELPKEMLKIRYCFPAAAQLDALSCCAVQARFAQAVGRLHDNPATRSLSARLDVALFLPLKIFFVLLVIAMGVLLAMARASIELHYRELIPSVERAMIVGGCTMLIWTAMDYGYQQTANVLFGRFHAGPQIRLSLVIAPWALLLLFYFMRRLGDFEIIGQIGGVLVAAIAVLRLDQLSDWVGRLFGAGADARVLVLQVVVAAAGIVALMWFSGDRREARAVPAPAV